MAADHQGEIDHFPDQQRAETPQIEALRAAGYAGDYEIVADRLVLRGRGPVDPADVHVDQQYRFEGASDPDDESLVLALHDPVTGDQGVLITAYGPSASAAEAAVLGGLVAAPTCPLRPARP